jgi:hypothetical protein
MIFGMPSGLFFKVAASASGIVIAIVLLQLFLEKAFNFVGLIPIELREDRGPTWLIAVIAGELLVYAIGPTVFYFWIYTVLPFFSYRAGLAVGVFLYLFGVLPFAISLVLRMKIPNGVIVFLSFFAVLKMLACWGLITWLLS